LTKKHNTAYDNIQIEAKDFHLSIFTHIS